MTAIQEYLKMSKVRVYVDFRRQEACINRISDLKVTLGTLQDEAATFRQDVYGRDF